MQKLLTCCLLATLTFAAVELGILFESIRVSNQQLQQSIQKLNETMSQVSATSVTVNKTVANFSGYVDKQVKNLDSQQKTINATIQTVAVFNGTGRLLNTQTIPRVNKLLDSANKLIQNTDVNINSLLSSLTETSKTFNVSLETLNNTIKDLSTKSSLTLDEINAIIASPEWHEVLAHINDVTANIDKASNQMPSIAASLEKIAKTSSKYQKAVILAEILSTIIRAFK